MDSSKDFSELSSAPKKRGRKPKITNEVFSNTPTELPKKRGRKPKNKE